MANVINRKTKQILYSVHTPDYQEPEWMMINGKHIPVSPSKYWKIINNEVLEMGDQEKAIIDYVEPVPELEPVTTQHILKLKNLVTGKITPFEVLSDELITLEKDESFAISYEG